jgi:hypothetical protein
MTHYEDIQLGLHKGTTSKFTKQMWTAKIDIRQIYIKKKIITIDANTTSTRPSLL